eukprot:Gregarina_sp_Pseudo_9__2991@NODE_31_length_5552_cov_77_542899_g29_i0_p3_GENE_NODE_31_length_5552_cov_77_542899_g29_i0NODE_31_length_5552_cov_77_542899_g29_i0_p3_ORF_typecomplete_len434_score94_49Sacchrp_dh_NADP/PF03435_18/9_9e313Beta_HSD/PF01073_19/6_4e07NAD_binding_10/PF13460_6/6e07adh_short/PF00106_25/9_3e06NmrA/PF05368_13/2e05Epimerase/PF01370_21/2_3e05Polysacc_synt_2/PF02719_15/0_00028DapB_N/PF01113_20/0_003DapB_N/PF01113_20/1_4e04KR/PF08659_10/0_015Semialdhyde_dh/PF01118_24/0_044GDP_Man_Deh
MALLSERSYDVIVWGATGYTGRLVCDRLASRATPVSWAIAGRNKSNMEALSASLRQKFQLPADQPAYFLADINDQQSMEKMAAKARCVIATAGPFTTVGEAALKACVNTGTHYVDSTAELIWFAKMRAKYQEEAEERKLKIVPSCGFDFVPNDMMMFQLDQFLRETETAPGSNKKYSIHARQVTHAFAQSTSMVSGGTAVSGMAYLRSLPLREVFEYYVSPFAMLSPATAAEISEDARNQNVYNILPTPLPSIRAYCTPFVMSNLMNKYIHWSNSIQNWKWGKNLVYHGGEKRQSVLTAHLYSLIIWIQFFLVFFLSRFPWTWKFLPQAGQGPAIDPSKAYMTSNLIASVPRVSPPSCSPAEEKVVHVSWHYNKGEAYLVSSLFLVEAAALISQKASALPETAGVLPPSAALGQSYLVNIQSAGVEMNIESNA